jgi:OOP family OmpA-OmpF porin
MARQPFAARNLLLVVAAIAALGTTTLAVTGTALAQPATDNFSALRFSPAPGPGNYLATDGTIVGGHMVPSAGLFVDYASEPFVLYNAYCDFEDPTNCDVTGKGTRLVKYTAVANIYATLALFERAQLALTVPVAYAGSERFAYTDPGSGNIVSVGGDSSFGLGDPRVHGKVRLIGDGVSGFTLGAAAYVTFPVANAMAEGAFLGESTLTAGGHAIAGLHLGRIHLLANFGGVFRPKQQLFSTTVGSTFRYNAAVGFDFTELLDAFVEAEGSSSFKSDSDENPLEARAAVRLRQGDFAFTLGGGAGILAGVGMPLFRLLGGIEWAPIKTDSDGDGLLDADDSCPAEAEDRDGFQDEDGCPEGDNDADGVADGSDACPNDAEDVDGVEDADGCPDLDNDGDGIPDGYDTCPKEKEDMDGDRDEDGCPDDDTDKDGIRDGLDKCPTEPEDTDGFGDEDGCPETDFDGDKIPDDKDECPDQAEILNGILDRDGCPEQDQDGDGLVDDVDKCPTEAETMNGNKDDDGCPDGDALIKVEGKQIVLLEQIRFGTNSARIVGKESKILLTAVATVLKRNPGFARIRIEGHTDNEGNADQNRTLSEKRAKSVLDALVKKGVKRDRLHALGHGPDKPLTSNDTEEGRAKNRRVEFHIEDALPETNTVAPAAAPAPAPAPATTPPAAPTTTAPAPAPEASATTPK